MTFALPSQAAAANNDPAQHFQVQTQQQLQPHPSSLAQQQQQQYSISQAQQSRQLQQQQQQFQYNQQLAMNGINGANMAAACAPSLPAGPTPAGHQAELNYIYGMVEELSRQLADNRRVTEEIVSGLGRVRNRARNQSLANDDLIKSAAPELEAENRNLDTLVSILSESLEKANFSRDANAALLSQYANALALMLKQFHEYKTKHVTDVASWHRSYRSQLDEARQENSRLREQIWEMQTHAGRANESLRQFRRQYDEDEKRWDRRVASTAMKQELRFWKRMAMPELEDDDPYWSGDDDVIDPAEKERLRDLDARVAQEQMEGGMSMDEMGDDGQQQHTTHMGIMGVGGIAMQRDESVGRAMPVPPPRPLSAASSTGSTGQ